MSEQRESDGQAPLGFRFIQDLFRSRSMHQFTQSWRGAAITSMSGEPPVDALTLLASAKRHAARGLRARDQGDHDDACLQSGIMLEHLAKARLALLHPALLLEDVAEVGLRALLGAVESAQAARHVVAGVFPAAAADQ